VRTRLIVAFIVVALLAALWATWFNNLIVPFYGWPSWLPGWVTSPPLIVHLLYKHHRGTMPHPPPGAVILYILAIVGLLLAALTAVAVVASRRVLRPVRRLARAAQRMSDGDLSVRIEPKGRDELARLTTTFNEMAAALEGKIGELERMEARARQFAGDVSHELRTPLTAMTAVADILPGQPGLTGDAAAAAQLVSREIRHLNRLVDDLIEISRFDAGTAQLVTDDTEVAAAVAACRRSRGWTDVAIDIPDGLTMPLDRRRFDVILANLIGNALCHGGPPVTVQAGLRPADGGSQLALVVRDHGPGIPAEAMPHVFERFYKADTARSRSEGSGLGLAIACENTRLHGGSIEVANHPGGGAVFTLLLPISRPEPARGTQPDEEPVAVTRS
jgi:two-component system, OmpR family, sensor histidine kinase MtrB